MSEHFPVMLEECMNALSLKDGGVYFDGTLGGGESRCPERETNLRSEMVRSRRSAGTVRPDETPRNEQTEIP